MNHIYQDIPGMMDYEDLYSDMVNQFPNNSHFVEVGVWKGRSAAFMAVEIINSGKYIKFDIVDNFRKSDIEQVKRNLSQVIDFITIVQADSAGAANQYSDNSIDFVFIDADHSGKAVVRDTLAWLPKIKKGGIIAGHDYGNDQYPDLKTAIDNLLKIEKVSNMCWLYRK
jgi:predicted O-methyltransferase YrrM